jgi:uncharacterized protein (UPF0212 family)
VSQSTPCCGASVLPLLMAAYITLLSVKISMRVTAMRNYIAQ